MSGWLHLGGPRAAGLSELLIPVQVSRPARENTSRVGRQACLTAAIDVRQALAYHQDALQQRTTTRNRGIAGDEHKQDRWTRVQIQRFGTGGLED